MIEIRFIGLHMKFERIYIHSSVANSCIQSIWPKQHIFDSSMKVTCINGVFEHFPVFMITRIVLHCNSYIVKNYS